MGLGRLGGVSGACLVHSYDAELVHIALHQAGHVGAARIAFHGGALVPQWAVKKGWSIEIKSHTCPIRTRVSSM